MKRHKLYFRSPEIEFLISVFATLEAAEKWRDFLAYCIKEFPFESMCII